MSDSRDITQSVSVALEAHAGARNAASAIVKTEVDGVFVSLAAIQASGT